MNGEEFTITDASSIRSVQIESESGQRSKHDLITLMKSGHVTLTDPLHGNAQLTDDGLANSHQLKRAHDIASGLREISSVRGEKTKGLEKLAEKFGVSLREAQRWNAKYKEKGLPGLISKTHKRGGLGKNRLSQDVEKIIEDGINEHLLCQTPVSDDEAIRLIRSKCAVLEVHVPSPNAVRKRINNIPKKKVLRAQKGSEHANDEMHVSRSKHNRSTRPLQDVQADHSPLDLNAVHPETRDPIGRPFLTVILDVYTRMILSLYIGLEHPSFQNLSWALNEAIHRKDELIERYNIQGEWPSYGVMESLDTDNAGEFDCENLDHFISENYVDKNFRPKGQKHFGGHVETAIGTIQEFVHTLPGTTFSNTKSKGDYDSENKAVLDMDEVRELIYRWVCERYHTKQRDELGGRSPIEMWHLAVTNGWSPRMPEDEAKLKLSLLHSKVKTISRHGISLFNHYYTSPGLTHWKSMETKGQPQRYRVHYDTRDMRWVYFVNPDNSGTTKLASTSIKSANPVTLKELQEMNKGSRRFPEATPDIYLSHQRNKDIISRAKQKKTKKQRRSLAQREDAIARVENAHPTNEDSDNIDYQSIPDWANSEEENEC